MPVSNEKKKMNILILSHQRSLNKTQSLIRNLHKKHRIFLVVDEKISKHKTYTSDCYRIFKITDFDPNKIIEKMDACDKIFCVSENLLPIQNKIETHFKIKNLSTEAGEILSNKFKLHKFCRSEGLGRYLPQTNIPFMEETILNFKGPVIIKPDIGTGSNAFLPPEFKNIDYKIWKQPTAFINFLNSNGLKKAFFKINKKAIKLPRFNKKPCRMMIQEFINPFKPTFAPCGLYRNGYANICFYLKIKSSLYKTNDDLSESGNIEIFSVPKSSIPDNIIHHSKIFIETLLSKLNIKELFFSGPDLIQEKDTVYAIDFNPRLGYFFNIIDKINNGTLFSALWNNKPPPPVFRSILWKRVKTKATSIKSLKWIEKFKDFIPSEAMNFKLEDSLPQHPTLQSRPKSIQLAVYGSGISEIHKKFEKIEKEINKELRGRTS